MQAVSRGISDATGPEGSAGRRTYDAATNNGVGLGLGVAEEVLGAAAPASRAIRGVNGVLAPIGIAQGAEQFGNGIESWQNGDTERGILDTAAGAGGVVSGVIGTAGALGVPQAIVGAGVMGTAGAVGGGVAAGVAIGDRGNRYARDTGVAGSRTRAGRGVNGRETQQNRDWSDMAADWGEGAAQLGGGHGTVGGEVAGFAGVAAGSVVGGVGAAVTGAAGIATDIYDAGSSIYDSVFGPDEERKP